MRCSICIYMLGYFQPSALNPGHPELEEAMDVVALQKEFRKCQNIKSRANPDVQCPFSAGHGDYCLRHYKNPRPFRPKASDSPRVYTRSENTAIKRIQRFWRRITPLIRMRHQGPAANCLALAMNETELYSLDTLCSIPKPYMISISDARKSIWVFDIRTLVHSMATGFPSHNPYTRETLTDKAHALIHRRIAWLRSRKYQILHVSTDTLTTEQCWNQKVLDIFLKIEALGYYVSCEWFHELGISEQRQFYQKIYSLWEWRLGLTRAEKERILPGPTPFRFSPEENHEKSKHWWEKTNLAIMEDFITRAQDKEQNKMAVLYVLMALVQVSRPAARALPWILDSVQTS